MRTVKPFFYLIFILFVSSPLGLLGQHQVITTKNDTLNCSEIEFNLEMEEVYCQLASSDNVLLFSPDDIATINYHFYPKYPDLSHPRFIVRTGIGIAISNYVQAFGNISTQNILKEELKRGAHFTIGGQYYINRSLFGVAAEYGHMWFKQSYDSINTWAMERLNNVGVGVAYCSKSVTKELFVTAQLLLTYSDYKTKGKIPAYEFQGENQMFGANLSATLNYHITEHLLLGFSGRLQFFDKKPSQPNKTSINLGVFEVAMGFSWIFP